MEFFMYMRKVARVLGWWYVITHILELKHQLDVIRLLSEKFGVKCVYDKWVKHKLLTTYQQIIIMVDDFDSGRGRNYQMVLKKIFGAL